MGEIKSIKKYGRKKSFNDISDQLKRIHSYVNPRTRMYRVYESRRASDAYAKGQRYKANIVRALGGREYELPIETILNNRGLLGSRGSAARNRKFSRSQYDR